MSKEYILSKQINWAKRQGLKLYGSEINNGEKTYVINLENNLFQKMCAQTKQQFLNGDGNEITDSGKSLAKMKALHSSSSITVNIFLYWKKKDLDSLLKSLKLTRKKTNVKKEMIFESKQPISKEYKRPPNLDLVIKTEDNKIFAIESKFTEPFSTYEKKGIYIKYINHQKLWNGIPNTYELAKKLCPENKEYKYLDASQLIKHILGLKNNYGKSKFKLLYLYYDAFSKEAYEHKKEIENFSEIVKKDNIKFYSMSYQELIIDLSKNYRENNEKYINYITERYL
ncbi:MAG: hypothetical protein PWP28_2377 [Oceanotoga sp.]|jgi:hypothetical protein|uniref:PGN_0703 family putative restriction endonuclease n=1 Tax=Oceanotoga sp. TaxID=2108366 RepID=UPI00264A748D|nr:hypothetical protein [Oceanotoga sp.]MDN5343497.1 hypothetical protein [Oceanotoga sp.]